MLAGPGIFAAFIFFRTILAFDSISVSTRFVGIGPIVVTVVGCAVSWGY
jgi:hypothetical protein